MCVCVRVCHVCVCVCVPCVCVVQCVGYTSMSCLCICAFVHVTTERFVSIRALHYRYVLKLLGTWEPS